jgi:arsenite methyltransferase
MKSQPDDVRREVSKAYSKAVTKPSKGGCCVSAPVQKSGCCDSAPIQKDVCCGSTPAQKGVVVKLGGYTSEELAALPTEAVVNSFGCGNPVALAGLQAGDVVLDLGSGAGIDLFLAAKKVGPTGRVIGIDMTDEMIAKANENIRAGKFTNVEVRKGIIEELPVESGSVDWVISNCVINLSPEKPRVFREIARVLKPGGRMLVSDIVAEALPEEIMRHAALYSSCIAGAISESQYLAGLRSAGLVDVEVRDRLVYDTDQIESFVASDLVDAGKENTTDLRALVRTIAGKVWSAKIYARKPL